MDVNIGRAGVTERALGTQELRYEAADEHEVGSLPVDVDEADEGRFGGGSGSLGAVVRLAQRWFAGVRPPLRLGHRETEGR